MNTMSIIAQATSTGADTFFGSTIGGVVKTLLLFVGTGFVLFSLVGAFKLFSTGKTSEAARKIIVALIIGAFCFRPEIVSTIIELFSGLLDRILDREVSTIIGDKGTPSNI